jgi:hypothetical protein
MIILWALTVSSVAAANGMPPDVCTFQVRAPDDVEVRVNGNPVSNGSGLVTLPCHGPTAYRVELYRQAKRVRDVQVTLSPGDPPFEVDVGDEGHIQLQPSLDDAADDPEEELVLPDWWEAALRGEPLGQQLGPRMRHLAQFFAGLCTSASGCGVWGLYVAAWVAAALAVVGLVALVVAAVVALLFGTSVLFGLAVGGGRVSNLPDFNCGSTHCGYGQCGSCGQCCTGPLIPGALERHSPLVYPVLLGHQLFQRGARAMSAALWGEEPTNDRGQSPVSHPGPPQQLTPTARAFSMPY